MSVGTHLTHAARLSSTHWQSHYEDRRMLLRPTLSLLFATIAFGSASASDAINFNQDVRPILSDKCYFCHGPDSNTREADLRLDIRDEAIDVIESGDLVERITSDDADMLMPPPHSKIELSEQDKKTIQRWIEQGADYQGHWAFELLPGSVEIPTVENLDWCRQELDHFVLSKLESENLTPSREANPLRWFRRAALDLTGLPPTLKQIEQFEKSVKDKGEAAYAEATQTLLDSPAFGEHMSVAWLDAARYADSYGYQSDKLNTQWPYRDWVVSALNNNLPYDQFLTWQLAGDLLENPTQDQLVATAFNRIHRLNNEGGAVFEEWRLENVSDRVHTFGTAMLGLTLECCRCHDHKYDPIPTRDYYSISAFFNSIDESGVYDRTEKVPCPSILLPSEEQQAAFDKAKQDLADAQSAYDQSIADARTRWRDWTPLPQAPLDSPDLRLALSFDSDFDNAFKDVYHPSQSDRSWTTMPELVDATESPFLRLDQELAADRTQESTMPPRRAMKLDGERGVTTHGIAPFDRWLPMTVIVSLQETKRSPLRSLIAHHTRGTDCGYNGWDLTIENGYVESRMARVWPGNAISVRTADPIPPNVWHQIAATYDGSSAAAGLKLWLNGQPLPTVTLRDQLKKSCNVKVDHGGEFVVGQRFRARGLDGGLIDDVRVYDRALTQTELQRLAYAPQSSDAVKPGLDYYCSAIDKTTRAALASLTDARKRLVMAEEAMNEIPIMGETPDPRPAHILARGEYDAPTSEETLVTRSTLSAIGTEIPADAPKNRLGLAKWLTDPNHPLTARVAVNRLWGNFFAAPFVRTPENFGSQGELPTHPELLDWLSRDFINNAWDVKKLCKSIVLSATYRQASAATSEQIQLDPANQLLARGPAYRLAAEQIRDLALSASGLLNSQVGGPPVSPYQPGEDLWKESNGMSPPYQQSVGKALYRRSLYSVWKRTAPLPNMLAFDSTTREVCSVKRSRTNTPIQALVLLNDVQFVEASRVLAEGLIVEKTVSPIKAAFLRLTGRHADEVEIQTLDELFQSEKAYYSAQPEAAKKLLSGGEAEFRSELDPAELAALTNVCQAILNLDATIWKR